MKKKADLLWSIKIRSIAHCELCGKTEFLNAHHFITRRFTPLRWDLRNGVCLDCKCHKFSFNSFHNNPFVAVDFLETNRMQDVNYLKEMSKQPIKKLEISDIEKIITDLSALPILPKK